MLPVFDLAELYSTELLAIADRLAPERSVTVRRRTSDPWFDEECCTMKRSVRAAERRASRCQSAVDVDKWTSLRRQYRSLRQTKRESFWRETADAARGRPQDLWKAFDTLLRRGRAPSPDVIGTSFFSRLFGGLRSTRYVTLQPMLIYRHSALHRQAVNSRYSVRLLRIK